MAVSDAVRRSGSALLRALAVGGLATAAWLACAGLASAGEDHPDEIATTLDAVNVALGEQQSATADPLLADPLASDPLLADLPASDLLGLPTFDHSAFAADCRPFDGPLDGRLDRPLAVNERPFEAALEVGLPSLLDAPSTDDSRAPHSDPYSTPYSDPNADAPYADPYEDDEYTHPGFTSGSSNYSHSGSVSNTMPAPLYEAKVAAKAAARAAASAPPVALPPPTAAPAPTAVRATALAGLDLLPVSASPVSQTTSNADVVWEVPNPSAPAPTPNQAPAPSAPTASSSSSADSGGGHRGGLIASFSSQSDPKPLAAWSTERWDGGRSPGSVPGLPSTSPD
ncbi:pyruvate/2-oxoglutarate dehydrogenase complex dihydrolipoamide acyltransferase (E2) component [Saccharothrix ecbatanensis]|uniref:Pyruvate/2-oxoglutarate dehydrogenase complex dihydrolipoamide acyltransferase (E2) component n=1 Tax=Saccharothrix ecbatanensis TaxID=1105145 RepID=A0A7W9HQ92_9PSEU|nr:hypothetical protein [Saccharothrix ecbatanensis]MBB5806400.1 pyruvate/2-oxoglutarate dehydrogenase complex dihydrolipoamide acyltransferase (E2) component [Saccharothrix ecbatanensis]